MELEYDCFMTVILVFRISKYVIGSSLLEKMIPLSFLKAERQPLILSACSYDKNGSNQTTQEMERNPNEALMKPSFNYVNTVN